MLSYLPLSSGSQTPNVVQYRRYHRINMSDFRLDLKNTSFVKSPADAVVDLYEQYVHDLGHVLDRLFIWGLTSLSTLYRSYHNG